MAGTIIGMSIFGGLGFFVFSSTVFFGLGGGMLGMLLG